MTTIGINTLVYMDALHKGVAQSEILPRIAKLGVALAEVRREFITEDHEFDAIAQAKTDNHLQLFYSVPESITVDGDVNPGFERYLKEARRMGVSNVKFNQGDVKDVNPEVLHHIDNVAAQYGVTLSIENDQTPENGTFFCTQASLVRITANNSSIGYTFDLGNWYWRKEDAEQAFTKLLEYITVFHLKNVNGVSDSKNLSTTMLQDGVIDWRNMLKRLPEEVPIFLEFPIPEDRINEQLNIVRAAIGQ